LAELGDLRRQSSETHAELAETRFHLTSAIERAASQPVASAPLSENQPLAAEAQSRLNELERERAELEAELELVRTRATELQETVNSQRRELAEQNTEFSSELRLLRELIEQNSNRIPAPAVAAPLELVGVAASSGRIEAEPEESPSDPVISSVMAQFARLQKDVAQRRKKK
jgi:hypothetical protein